MIVGKNVIILFIKIELNAIDVLGRNLSLCQIDEKRKSRVEWSKMGRNTEEVANLCCKY